MNTDSQGLDHDAAERLLAGAPGDPRAVPQPLAGLLAAASARGTEAELAGEEAAVAAFHAAALSPETSSPRVAGRAWFPLTRLLPVKIAALALVGATAAGGLTYAAHLGKLPLGPLAPGPNPTITPERSHTSQVPGLPQGVPGNPAVSPSLEAMAGLCRSYEAVEPADRAAELGKPALSALVRAAGGTERVPSYCAGLRPPSQGRQSPRPGESEAPSEEPATGKPRPTGPGNNNGNGSPNPARPDPPNGKPENPGKPTKTGRPEGENGTSNPGNGGSGSTPRTGSQTRPHAAAPSGGTGGTSRTGEAARSPETGGTGDRDAARRRPEAPPG
ncbi:hypothetical protein [Actinomadura sp. 21ATH]|uniref:hypothetical protein n=1 Tax=Actinomadura sp. 21ATH TaxID=1735444 RepID=UPI0035BFD495